MLKLVAIPARRYPPQHLAARNVVFGDLVAPGLGGIDAITIS